MLCSRMRLPSRLCAIVGAIALLFVVSWAMIIRGSALAHPVPTAVFVFRDAGETLALAHIPEGEDSAAAAAFRRVAANCSHDRISRKMRSQ